MKNNFTMYETKKHLNEITDIQVLKLTRQRCVIDCFIKINELKNIIVLCSPHTADESRFFSNINFSSGYWQTPVVEENVSKNAFVIQAEA